MISFCAVRLIALLAGKFRFDGVPAFLSPFYANRPAAYENAARTAQKGDTR